MTLKTEQWEGWGRWPSDLSLSWLCKHKALNLDAQTLIRPDRAAHVHPRIPDTREGRDLTISRSLHPWEFMNHLPWCVQ